MSSRFWGVAVLGLLTLTLMPASGPSQTSSYDKEAVKALSKRIDAHLAKVWKQAKVTPEPKADDYVFLRRLNLDLVGRIPKLQYITDFMDDDNRDKRWTWVDRLLDDTDNARPEHFANVWRAILLGNQTNQQFQFLMPQFETWLRERIQTNVPLDKMVHELLMGQQQNQNNAFQFGGRVMQPGSPQLFYIANENKAENLAGATSRVFLGVKIECAQCHAHPFAKWSKEQFWEFAAFYSAPQLMRRPGIKLVQPAASGAQAGREIQIPGTDKVVKAKFLNGETPKWDSNPRKTLADWMTAPQNPYFAKAMADHIWSYLMGVSLLEPIMEPSDDAPITHPELLNDLAKGLIANHFDAKFLIRAIVHSDAYQRSSGGKKLAEKEDYNLFVRMPMRALSPEQIYDSIWVATKNSNDTEVLENPNQFFNPVQSPRRQFLAKFMSQDRRHEPQTSILQALFMMNGKFMAEKTKVENSESLQAIVNGKYPEGNEGRVRSMYRLVLSRVPHSEEYSRLSLYLDEKQAQGQLAQGVSDVYWALLNTSEFLHNH